MRKPEERLDNFVVNAEPKAAEPPPPVSLRLTGKVRVLKAVSYSEDPATRKTATVGTSDRPSPRGISWFHSSLVAAGGLAMIALVLLSAIVIGIYETAVERAGGSVASTAYPGELPFDQQLYDALVPTEERLTPDISASSPLEGAALSAVRSTARPRRAKTRVRLAAYRPLRRYLRPRLVVTEFVPTTLVIYAQNGEIKSRIEPQITTGYKKPMS